MKDIYLSKEKVRCDKCGQIKNIWEFSSIKGYGYNCKVNQCIDCFYEEVEK